MGLWKTNVAKIKKLFAKKKTEEKTEEPAPAVTEATITSKDIAAPEAAPAAEPVAEPAEATSEPPKAVEEPAAAEPPKAWWYVSHHQKDQVIAIYGNLWKSCEGPWVIGYGYSGHWAWERIAEFGAEFYRGLHLVES